jgi:hypothetical protein
MDRERAIAGRVAKRLAGAYADPPYAALSDGMAKASAALRGVSSDMSRWRQFHRWDPATYAAISGIIEGLEDVDGRMHDLKEEARKAGG